LRSAGLSVTLSSCRRTMTSEQLHDCGELAGIELI